MSDPDTREKHSRSYKRNIMAKTLKDSGDHKGAFSLKIVDARKGTYKRKKLRTTDIESELDE